MLAELCPLCILAICLHCSLVFALHCLSMCCACSQASIEGDLHASGHESMLLQMGATCS